MSGARSRAIYHVMGGRVQLLIAADNIRRRRVMLIEEAVEVACDEPGTRGASSVE